MDRRKFFASTGAGAAALAASTIGGASEAEAQSRRYPASPGVSCASAKLPHCACDNCGYVNPTLALQMDHNHSRQGRHGLLLIKLDRVRPGVGRRTWLHRHRVRRQCR